MPDTTVAIKKWPPTNCQACLSTNIEHVYDEGNEGTTDWAFCRDCKAEQIFWFQNVDGPAKA
jgi:hypothetical protein